MERSKYCQKVNKVPISRTEVKVENSTAEFNLNYGIKLRIAAVDFTLEMEIYPDLHQVMRRPAFRFQ